jgi:hypothetical protein
MQIHRAIALSPNPKEKIMKKLTLVFISTIFLSTIVLTTLSTYAGTWRDDFEDNDIREWEIFNLNRQFEKWWINDGEAVGEIFENPFFSLWTTGELTWEYYTVSCRAKMVEDGKGPPHIGLALHDRGEENSSYFFLIDYVNETASIERWAAGNGNVVRAYTAEIDTWYELEATVYEDGSLSFRINDFTIEGIDRTPLEGGKAGLVVGNARARFDDFQITGENIPNGGPGKSRPVAPQAKLATTWGRLKMK